MKNKIIGIILTVLVFAVPIGITVFRGQANVAPEPDSVKVVYTNIFTPVDGSAIAGPGEAAVGELVRLQVKGEQVKWQVLPSVPDIETYGAANEKCVISFRRTGEYTIIAAVLSDKVVALQTIKIVVGGVSPSPGPVTPGPNNPPVGPSVNADLTAKVKSWASESKVNKQLASNLAKNFNQVASEIQAGSLKTTGEIINRTASLNQSLDLKGFDGVMAKIQAYLTQQADSGVLSTPEQHVTVWYSIASGLDGYSKEPSGSKR